MPSTIVKMSSSDARAWAHNQPLWLDENGDVARPVTREEQYAIGRALERSRRVEQSFRLSVPLLPLPAASGRRTPTPYNARGIPGVKSMELAFDIGFYGQKRVVTVYLGTLRHAVGREVLAARLLADHGECVLHGRNGKCIAVLRDPLIGQRPPVTGRRVQWSRNPEDARLAEERLAQQDLHGVPQVRRRGHTASRTSGVVRTVYSPEKCPYDCRGLRGGGEWTLAKGARPPTSDEHHPICQYAAGWSSNVTPPESSFLLYDLELGTMARPAEPSEIAEAEDVQRRTGVPQITVAGRLFAVLPAQEAKQAAREARGEGDEPGPDAVHQAVHQAIDGEFEEVTDPDHDAPDWDERVDLPSSATVAAAPAPTTAIDRSQWPTLEQLRPSEQFHRQRAEVTARDYLSRQPPPQVRPT